LIYIHIKLYENNLKNREGVFLVLALLQVRATQPMPGRHPEAGPETQTGETP
jgi:hypothetical protein